MVCIDLVQKCVNGAIEMIQECFFMRTLIVIALSARAVSEFL